MIAYVHLCAYIQHATTYPPIHPKNILTLTTISICIQTHYLGKTIVINQTIFIFFFFALLEKKQTLTYLLLVNHIICKFKNFQISSNSPIAYVCNKRWNILNKPPNRYTSINLKRNTMNETKIENEFTLKHITATLDYYCEIILRIPLNLPY